MRAAPHSGVIWGMKVIAGVGCAPGRSGREEPQGGSSMDGIYKDGTDWTLGINGGWCTEW